jgi:hypothetical protein
MFLKVKAPPKKMLNPRILPKLPTKTFNLPLKTAIRKNLHPPINKPILYKRHQIGDVLDEPPKKIKKFIK